MLLITSGADKVNKISQLVHFWQRASKIVYGGFNVC